VELRSLETRATVVSGLTSPPSEHAILECAPGQYWARVDPSTLPEGYIPPFRQDREDRNHKEGAYAEVVVVEAGEVVDAILRVWLESTIHGTVYGPDGDTQQYTVVRASSLEGLPFIAARTVQVAEDGTYRLQVYPGPWQVRIFERPLVTPEGEVDEEAVHPMSLVCRPWPSRVELSPGEDRRLDLHYSDGPGSISGTVVDQFGDPMADLQVWAYPAGMSFNRVMASRITDIDGRFELSGMLLGDYEIWITDANTPLDDTPGGLSEWIDAVPVSIESSNPRIDTGVHLAVTSARFHARGVIHGGPDNHAKMSMKVVVPDGKKQRWGRIDLVVTTEVDQDGSFTWAVPVGIGGQGRIEVEFGGTTQQWPFQLERTTELAPFVFVLDWE
jgi:hypothetical protein